MTKQRSRKRSTRKKLRQGVLVNRKERLEDVKSRKLATSNGNADPDMMPLATQMGDDLMKKIDDEYLEKFGADDEYSLQDIHEYRRKDLYKYDVEYLREMVKYMHTLFELRKKQIEEFKAKTRELEESGTEWLWDKLLQDDKEKKIKKDLLKNTILENEEIKTIDARLKDIIEKMDYLFESKNYGDNNI